MKQILAILFVLILAGIGTTVEAQSPDSLIGQVMAYDKDTTQTLTFEIVEGNEEGLFHLTSSGMLYWRNRPTGLTEPKRWVLTIKVTDNGTPPLSSKAACTVFLTPNLKTP
ncbi:MAG: cadherin repeat domain-containing protein [Dehalococcoidia bacterium]|jgi:hypothetical protein